MAWINPVIYHVAQIPLIALSKNILYHLLLVCEQVFGRQAQGTLNDWLLLSEKQENVMQQNMCWHINPPEFSFKDHNSRWKMLCAIQHGAHWCDSSIPEPKCSFVPGQHIKILQIIIYWHIQGVFESVLNLHNNYTSRYSFTSTRGVKFAKTPREFPYRSYNARVCVYCVIAMWMNVKRILQVESLG